MMQIDQYLPGYRQAEQEGLQRQAQMLAGDAQALFDQIGVFSGAQVVEIGCGPQGYLDLLAERVGPGGTVMGVERSEDAVRLAKRFVADRKLAMSKSSMGTAARQVLREIHSILRPHDLSWATCPIPSRLSPRWRLWFDQEARLRSMRPIRKVSSAIRRCSPGTGLSISFTPGRR